MRSVFDIDNSEALFREYIGRPLISDDPNCDAKIKKCDKQYIEFEDTQKNIWEPLPIKTLELCNLEYLMQEGFRRFNFTNRNLQIFCNADFFNGDSGFGGMNLKSDHIELINYHSNTIENLILDGQYIDVRIKENSVYPNYLDFKNVKINCQDKLFLKNFGLTIYSFDEDCQIDTDGIILDVFMHQFHTNPEYEQYCIKITKLLQDIIDHKKIDQPMLDILGLQNTNPQYVTLQQVFVGGIKDCKVVFSKKEYNTISSSYKLDNGWYCVIN